MPKSNIDCKHIKELNCPNYDENRLCPDNCEDFVAKERIIYEDRENRIENPEQKFEKRRGK